MALKVTIPVNKEPGFTNFENPKIAQEPMTKHTIAIVSPKFEGAATQKKESNQNSDMTPQQIYLARAMGGGFTEYDSNNHFSSSYSPDLKTAMEQAFMELLTKKGFMTKGPYGTFDDITYGDKKTIYLAVVPVLNISINKSPTSKKNENLYYSEEGVFTVTGELYLKVIEPLTQQAMINRRINLSDFGIQKKYIYQYQHNSGSDSLMESAIEKATAPKELKDNTEKVMAEATSEFYTKAIEKINAYLSREELLSLEKEIANLKELKRF